MATTHMQINAPPERVFAVLADPGTYADWVVGSDTIRDADPSWPTVGSLSRLGINPLTDWFVHLRNRESLRRLKRIAETGVVNP